MSIPGSFKGILLVTAQDAAEGIGKLDGRLWSVMELSGFVHAETAFERISTDYRNVHHVSFAESDQMYITNTQAMQ